jgi:2-dehydropantoate 2-reductase
MRICVFGAGAVGGSIAVRLHLAGAEISVVARGAHGQAIRASGLTLDSAGERVVVRVRCVDDPRDLAAHDVVIVAVKGTHLPGIAPSFAAMVQPATRVVFAMNGVPWWFGDGAAITLPDPLLERLDPGAHLRRALNSEQIVGAVVYSSNEVIAPGVIRNSTPRNRIVLGKPGGHSDPVVHALAGLLQRGGYDAICTPAIRQELWIKMLIVVGASPVAALTGCSLQQLVNDDAAFALMTTLMREGTALGRRLGFAIPDDIDARLAYYRDKPARPSMLQDFEAGRAPELDNGILAFCAIAAAAGVAVPVMDAIATLVRMKAHTITRRTSGDP